MGIPLSELLHVGHLYHIFCPVLISRVFFNFLERKNQEKIIGDFELVSTCLN